MNVNKKVIFWLTASVVVMVTFWLAFFYKPAAKVTEAKLVPVEVQTVVAGSIEETIELAGWIKANATVDVSSKVAGRLESLRTTADDGSVVNVEEGLAVKKGQHLAVIDQDVYVAQASAARANVQATEVTLADAQREKERMTALFKGGSATQQAMDKAITAADLAAAQLDVAKANLRLAEINVRESIIISPIDGTITARHIDGGNLIKIGDRIVTVEDANTVKIVVAVPERYTEKIKPQMPARIKVDAWPEKVFDANVFSVWPSLDEQTHTLQVEIRLDNSGMLLKPGMFARVTLVPVAKSDIVVVPRDVILGGKIDRHYVYVVNGSTAHKRFVEVGITQGDKFEITEGLKPGETIIVNGMKYLADGIEVEVVRMGDVK
jgi:membrane fusion protein (multidrug efflux system)